MQYPDFFNEVETIKVNDPLGVLLGAFNDNLEISYLDCVKFAGHSCLTVAGAYLMALYGLKELFDDGVAVRGNVQIQMRDAKDYATTGVVASVLSYVVGAREEDGFKGLAGNHKRANLLSYTNSIDNEVRFTRVDTGVSVEINYILGSLLLEPIDQTLFQKILTSSATLDERQLFGKTWQKRVEQILLTHKDNALKINKI